jgi:putative redox protein
MRFMETVTVQTEEGYRVRCIARSHQWYADLPEASGGKDSAPNPEELFLGSLGACMTETGLLYADRKKWKVDGIEIRLELERIDPVDYPGCAGEAKFAHRIREYITLKGDLDDEQRTRMMEIIRKCPVRRIVANPVVFEEELLELAPQF